MSPMPAVDEAHRLDILQRLRTLEAAEGVRIS